MSDIHCSNIKGSLKVSSDDYVGWSTFLKEVEETLRSIVALQNHLHSTTSIDVQIRFAITPITEDEE